MRRRIRRAVADRQRSVGESVKALA
jgi:hypothetical protein